MRFFRLFGLAVLLSVLFMSAAFPEGLNPLPLDQFMAGPRLDKANFDKNNTHYEDESITVDIAYGKFKGVPYTTARIKIADASQLRTVSGRQARNPNDGAFGGNNGVATGKQICEAVNAVVGLNGDYCITEDKCKVMMRQCKQIRNRADGGFDVLIIDKNGDFTAIRRCTADMYKEYYKAHKDEMYNVFCFGPVVVTEGHRTIGPLYQNRDIIAREKTQRAAIAQIGHLEYMLITSDGDAIGRTWGLTVMDFSELCETLGLEAAEGGFQLAFNLDGGNSAALIYPQWDQNQLSYAKLNMPDVGRPLSDMICFFSLVGN